MEPDQRPQAWTRRHLLWKGKEGEGERATVKRGEIRQIGEVGK